MQLEHYDIDDSKSDGKVMLTLLFIAIQHHSDDDEVSVFVYSSFTIFIFT